MGYSADAAPSVYVTRRWTDGVMAHLATLDADVRVHPSAEVPPTRAELLEGAQGVAGIFATVTDRIDGEVLDAAGEGLRIVANGGVGIDNVDLRGAAQRGVVVTNTPGVLDEATADLAFGLILATSRRIVEADRFVRSGTDWIWGPRMYAGLDLSAGATLGVVGLGRIGMAVARRAHAFGMSLLATGRRAHSEEARALGVRPVALDEVLAEADVVTLHCPLNDDTHHLIGPAELDLMRPDAVLVNTARGPVVDEDALVAALRTGGIGAAGLDVFENEPRVHPGLLELDNAVLLPHIGSAGTATRDRMGALAVNNMAAVLAGEDPLTPV